jgi:hypothetical protein
MPSLNAPSSAVWCALSVLAAMSTAGPSRAAPPEFVTPAQRPAPDLGAKAIRQRPVDVHPSALSALNHAGGDTLTLPLFDDASLQARFDRFYDNASTQTTSWSGTIVGDPSPHGWFVLTVAGGTMVMNIWTGGATYQVHAGADGLYVAEELSQSLITLDSDDAVAVTVAPGPGGGGTRTCSDDGSQIDVLMVWTPGARVAAGGAGQILATAQNSIITSNIIYGNSQIATRLRLVHAEEVVYLEDPLDMGQDLARLASTSDGIIDGVHDLRDQYQADMVCMLVNSQDSGACGIGYLMQNLSHSFARSAFSVVDQACVPGFTVTHELGHNMGCEHDREHATNTPLYAYSYGWRWLGFSGNTYRDVMAYAPGTRVGFLSNPFVLYDGIPTGISAGPNAANNALTINNSASTVANFRASGDIDIQQQPEPITVPIGHTATFTVAASSGSALSYQWRRDNVDMLNGGRVSGARAATLSISGAIPADQGQYTVVISTSCTSTTSAAAGLVVCRPDLNGDGQVNVQDYLAFLQLYAAADPRADFNSDGHVNVQDYLAFLQVFAGGC